jgi:DNA-directed RNA polymerase subunit RPC12/RpoP
MGEELKISCQYCNGHIAFPREYLGQTIACPHCSNQIVLAEKPNELNEPKTVFKKGLASRAMRNRIVSGVCFAVLTLGQGSYTRSGRGS